MRIFFFLLCAAIACHAHAQDVTVLVKPGSPGVTPGVPDGKLTVFPTIQNALDHAPWPEGNGRVIIRITPGTYHERVFVPRNRPRVTLLGLGASPADVVITSDKFGREQGGTFFTETTEVTADEFVADNITFQNSAGPVGQALAISVYADKVIFKHCRFIGWQDTVFANWGRQYYVDSYIEGATDFIFGNATAVFDNDEVHVVGQGPVTAQSRSTATQSSGYVFVNSRITTTPGATGKGVALGRPWRAYSRVVFLHCAMDAGVLPAGWDNWGDADNEKTAFYGEFDSSGDGAQPAARVPWAHALTAAEARRFMPKDFLRGSDLWNPVAEAAKLP